MTKIQNTENHIQRVIREMTLQLQGAVPFSDLDMDATFTLLGPDAPTLETLRKREPNHRGANAITLDGHRLWQIPDAWLCVPEYAASEQAA